MKRRKRIRHKSFFRYGLFEEETPAIAFQTPRRPTSSPAKFHRSKTTQKAECNNQKENFMNPLSDSIKKLDDLLKHVQNIDSDLKTQIYSSVY